MVFAGDTKATGVFSFTVIFLFFAIGAVVVISAGDLVNAASFL